MKMVRIAGGGLAGLSLATALLRRGVPVRVDEAGRYPRHRVCGEFVSGVSDETLRRLGIDGVFTDARRHRSVAWFCGSRAVCQAELPDPALGISRFRLDQRLCELVREGGGEVRENSRIRPAREEGFVWAAGRIPERSEWIGLKCHLRGLPMTADLEMHLATNGYAGLAGIEDGEVNVCGLFRVDRSRRAGGAALLFDYLERGGLGELVERLGAAEVIDESVCAVAGFRLGRQSGQEGLCSVGDSQSVIPPFTGNGMSMAFQAAETAMEQLVGWSRGELGWQDCREGIACGLGRRFDARLRAAGWMHGMLLSNAGRQALTWLGRARLLPFRALIGTVR